MDETALHTLKRGARGIYNSHGHVILMGNIFLFSELGVGNRRTFL